MISSEKLRPPTRKKDFQSRKAPISVWTYQPRRSSCPESGQRNLGGIPQEVFTKSGIQIVQGTSKQSFLMCVIDTYAVRIENFSTNQIPAYFRTIIDQDKNLLFFETNYKTHDKVHPDIHPANLLPHVLTHFENLGHTITEICTEIPIDQAWGECIESEEQITLSDEFSLAQNTPEAKLLRDLGFTQLTYLQTEETGEGIYRMGILASRPFCHLISSILFLYK